MLAWIYLCDREKLRKSSVRIFGIRIIKEQNGLRENGIKDKEKSRV
jgi:hypothetical protein